MVPFRPSETALKLLAAVSLESGVPADAIVETALFAACLELADAISADFGPLEDEARDLLASQEHVFDEAQEAWSKKRKGATP